MMAMVVLMVVKMELVMVMVIEMSWFRRWW